MTEADKLVSIAVSQIGVTEDPKGSNNVPYNTAYYGREVSGSAYPWCMVFVWWCFKEAGLQSFFYDGKKTASCTTIMRWAKQTGQFVTSNFRRGDVLLFQFDADEYADHTGILEEVKDGKLIVIEGNTNDEVRRVTRTVSQLHGAWRPRFEEQEENLPILSFGSRNDTVRAMQILLEGYGFSCGRYGCDGEFGEDTRLALLRFQNARGLEKDGICGEKTWGELLGL